MTLNFPEDSKKSVSPVSAGERFLRRADIHFVLWVSAFVGFCYGILNHNYGQKAVEGAQVVAGLVHYPPFNPFYLYQMKVWTLLHQIPAIFLWLGMDEIKLSLLISGCMGLLAFQALALILFAFSGNRWSALLFPFFIFHTSLYSFGSIYPLSLTGDFGTYGVIGISWCMLTLILLSVGEDAPGGVMLGLAPAIHITLGFFTWGIVLISGGFEFSSSSGDRWKKFSLFFLTGIFLMLISAAVHQVMIHTRVPSGLTVNREFFFTFVKYWDAHRFPVSVASEDFVLNLTAFFLFWKWRSIFKEDLFPEARWILRMMMTAAVLGIVSMVITWIPIEKMPWFMTAMIPARLLTFNHYAFGAIFLGIMDRYRGNFTANLFLVFFLCLMLRPFPLLTRGFDNSFALLIVSSLLFFCLRRNPRSGISDFSEKKGNRYLRGAVYGIIGIVLWKSIPVSIDNARLSTLYSNNPGRNPVFAEAAKRSSLLLLEGDFGSIQLWIRRPVLMDVVAIDGMLYVPEGGSLVLPILRDIYGVDLFHPEKRRDMADQSLWESRTREAWIKLAQKYQFFEILTLSAWKLQLPLVIQDEMYALYQIPPEQMHRNDGFINGDVH